MILAVLDDLMFSSKIKTAANQLGVDLRFSRSVDGAIETMRKNPTTLVIFDLNNERIGPLAIVAKMKEDPALAAIPTVGYASHVQTEVINAARMLTSRRAPSNSSQTAIFREGSCWAPPSERPITARFGRSPPTPPKASAKPPPQLGSASGREGG